MKNKINLITSALILGLMLVSLISAFGVSSPYWNENPLKMARGESTTVNLNLQNMVGEGDVSVKVILIEGEDITYLPQEIYTVKGGTSDTMIPLKIKIPKDAQPGETKKVKIEFKTIQGDTKGIVMGTGMTIAFDVIATSEVASNSTKTIILAIAVIILALILWYLVKKKKKK